MKGILAATKVVLLFDPEYLTAANYRKECLLAISGDEPKALANVVRDELRFIECILDSPLHRQSKSPTLWYHRYWIIRTFGTVAPDDRETMPYKPNSCLDIDRDFFDRELDIVLIAAEHHQHNYYAFLYMRRLLGIFTVLQPIENYQALVVSMLGKLAIWTRSHPSDTSGWSFLLYLMRGLPSDSCDVRTRVVSDTLNFAVKMDWRREALWHFLRASASNLETLPSGDENTLIKRINHTMDLLSPFSVKVADRPR